MIRLVAVAEKYPNRTENDFCWTLYIREIMRRKECFVSFLAAIVDLIFLLVHEIRSIRTRDFPLFSSLLFLWRCKLSIKLAASFPPLYWYNIVNDRRRLGQRNKKRGEKFCEFGSSHENLTLFRSVFSSLAETSEETSPRPAAVNLVTLKGLEIKVILRTALFLFTLSAD